MCKIFGGITDSQRTHLKENEAGYRVWDVARRSWNYTFFHATLKDLHIEIDDSTAIVVTGEPNEVEYFQNKLREIDPAFTIHRLPDWESYLGVPDVFSTGLPKNDTESESIQWTMRQDAVFGDMWFNSYADALIYNLQSTCSRTMVLWNVLNNSRGKIWPAEWMFKNLTQKIETVGCTAVSQPYGTEFRFLKK